MPTARDSDLLIRVRTALADVPHVAEKRMFGGTAFMVQGKMCITARAERLMCRIDPALHDAALERDGCQTVVMKGREYRGYVFVAADAVTTTSALTYWIDLALTFNKTFASKPRRAVKRSHA